MSYEQPRRRPLPIQYPSFGDDNGRQGFKWMRHDSGMGLGDFVFIGLIGLWIASATIPVVYRMYQQQG